MSNGDDGTLASTPCPFCGAPVVVENVRETMEYVTPKGAVELVVDVPHEECAACGYQGYGEAGERARTEAIYRYHQRLTPWEIARIRESLSLTQKAFAVFVGVGHASIERWESGVSMQNQGSDNLILLLSNPSNKTWLDNERRKREQKSLKEQPLVPLDRFRSLSEAEIPALQDNAKRFRLRR